MTTRATRGRDTTIYFNGTRVSAYLDEYEQEAEADDLEFTPFEAADKEYLTGSSENTTTLTGTWNGSDGALDDLLDTAYAIGSSTNQLLLCPAGILTAGKSGLMLGDASVQKQKTKGKSDDINEFEAELRSKRQRAIILKTPVAVTATGNGPAFQAAAASDFGAIATVYLEAVTGTVVPTGLQFDIEHSDDGTTYSVFGNIASTLTASDVGQAFRFESDNTLELKPYVRVKHTITGGTAPSVKYVAALHRRLAAY